MDRGMSAPAAQSTIPFLTLPFAVRHRIYVLTGLLRFCPIDLNHQGRGRGEYAQMCTANFCQMTDLSTDLEQGQPVMSLHNAVATWACFYRIKRFEAQASSREPDRIDCMCGPLPTSLVLVLRATYREVSGILYSGNQFKICRTAPKRFHSTGEPTVGDPFWPRYDHCQLDCNSRLDSAVSSRHPAVDRIRTLPGREDPRRHPAIVEITAHSYLTIEIPSTGLIKSLLHSTTQEYWYLTAW